MADDNAMVIVWSAVVGFTVVGVLVAMLVGARRDHLTDQTRPGLLRRGRGKVGTRRPPRPDPPDIETVNLHAEADLAPRHYEAARLVAWSVHRSGDDEEIDDESTG